MQQLPAADQRERGGGGLLGRSWQSFSAYGSCVSGGKVQSSKSQSLSNSKFLRVKVISNSKCFFNSKFPYNSKFTYYSKFLRVKVTTTQISMTQSFYDAKFLPLQVSIPNISMTGRFYNSNFLPFLRLKFTTQHRVLESPSSCELVQTVSEFFFL
jgi:hypothetical protein